MRVIESAKATTNGREVILAERKGISGEEYVIIIDNSAPKFSYSKEYYTEEQALEKFDEVFLQVYNGQIFG